MPIKIDDDDKPTPQKTLAEEAVTSTSARDLFLKKPRRVDSHQIKLNGQEVEIKVEGIDTREFNRLVADHPPRRSNDRDKNAGFNQDTFPPAFLSRAIIEPKLTEDEWADLFSSPAWTPGELGALVDLAWSAANRGFDVPFGGNG